jgi:hypothetical protein
MRNKLTTLIFFALALIGHFTVAHASCCGLFSIQYNEPTASDSYISKIEYVQPSLPEFTSYYIVEERIVEKTKPVYKTYTYSDHKYNYRHTHKNYHYNDHVKIESVSYDNTVSTCDSVSYTIQVKNIGPLDEEDMRISVSVDGKTVNSEEFSLPEDRTRTKVLNLRAPCSSGNYPVIVKAYNAYHSIEYSSWLYVSGRTTYIQEPVIIRRATPTVVTQPAAQQPVINNYITVVVSGENGEAQADGTTKIVVKDGKVSVEDSNVKKKVTNSTQQTAPSGPSGKVDVSVSAKELDVSRSEGNLLKITVSNNGNKDSLFELRTDFDATQTFLPESEVIQKGETHTFSVYFTPNEQTGRRTGNLFVIQDNVVVKTLPVTVYASPVSTTVKQASATKYVAGLNWTMIVGALALIAAIIFALYFSNQNRGLRNKLDTMRSPLMPLHRQIREETYRITPKNYGPDTYNATWDQVIE